MKKILLEIKNEQGLHARPSTKFVEITQRFNGNINVQTKNEVVDGKNVMGLMLLALAKGEKFTVIAISNVGNTSEEEKVLLELKNLVEVLKFHEK